MNSRMPSEYRNDRRLKAALIESLRSRGFHVDPLAASRNRSADFRLTSTDDTIIVELKARAPVVMPPSPEVRLDAFAPTNPVSALLSKAAKQLSSSRTSADEITVLWLLAPNVDQTLHYQQLAATAYGLRDVVGPGFIKPCFYATHGGFFRHREHVDGIALGHFGALLLNDYSPRCERLGRSLLADLFQPSVTNPVASEARGDAFLVRGDIDRNDDAAVKAYIEEHYEVEVNHFSHMVRFSA